MKYLFLNHFAFENIDNSTYQQDIIEIFTNVSTLSKKINMFNSQLIFDNKLASFINYIKLIEDRAIRIFLMTKIRNPKPFCSDSFDEYFEDKNIVLGNCIVEGATIDILENFLACAMFLDSPIITPKSICKNRYFLDKTIYIKCDNGSKELKNYFLENTKEILDDLEIYIESLEVKPLEYCLRKFKDGNLNFTLLDDSYGFNILNSSQEKDFLSTFKKFSQMNWIDIIKSSANKKGLNYKSYDGDWFKNTIYSDINIFKFRTSQKYRCFGYRKDNEFFILRFEIDHRISDNG